MSKRFEPLETSLDAGLGPAMVSLVPEQHGLKVIFVTENLVLLGLPLPLLDLKVSKEKTTKKCQMQLVPLCFL